jgi:glycosyltransferase involved in cell wall biosynthesis
MDEKITQTMFAENEIVQVFTELKNRIALIMPVYNEAETIEMTVRELYQRVVNKMENVDVWVFEDGSVDGTKEILEKLQDEIPNFRAVMSKDRKGYPKAMSDAFLSIDPSEYQYVVSIDSDGQYAPDDFFKLWQVMQSEQPDVVMGKRVTRKEPAYRKLLSGGLRVLEKIMFPVKCNDVTSVMRLMKVDLAHEIAGEVKYSPYNFWLEFTARSALKNCRIREIPINYRERSGTSKVYSLSKIPKIVFSEFSALRALRNEKKRKSFHSVRVKGGRVE